MIGEQPTFLKGRIYAIINKSADYALKPKEISHQKFHNSKIIGQQFNPQDDTQLYFIDKVSPTSQTYQIVNLKTGLVFTVDGKQVVFEFGKQKSTQLFSIVKANLPGFFTYYWIKQSQVDNKALVLQGYLKYATFDPNAQNQLFRFEEIPNNNTVVSSFVLINKRSGKALDVPGGTFELEERIIQYQINRRFNQRWRWVKYDKGYLIQNVLTGLFLDIAGESRSFGAKVIQWTHTANTNQQWIPEAEGHGQYRIRSVHQPSAYLAIKDNSLQDGGKLEINSQNQASIHWIIEGALP